MREDQRGLRTLIKQMQSQLVWSDESSQNKNSLEAKRHHFGDTDCWFGSKNVYIISSS